MATTIRKPGFYATPTDVFYLAPSGRSWLVASDDGPESVSEVAIPDHAAPCDDLLSPDEAIEHCRRVEEASGEVLVEEAR